MKPVMHDRAARQVEALAGTRSGSFVFFGPKGVGKSVVARDLSRRLNCQGDEPTKCRSCIQHDAGSWPDLIIVRPEDKPSIIIEQIRLLTQAVSLSIPGVASTRVVIIEEAQALTIDAGNALLKLLEEPPPQTLFILITDQPDTLLPTVRSRCAHIYFPPVSTEQVTSVLLDSLNLEPVRARQIADISDGVPGIAVTLATDKSVADSRLHLQEVAASLRSKSLFERLLQAKSLIDSKADLVRLVGLIHQHYLALLSQGQLDLTTVAQGLDALGGFRRAYQANVSSRVALERLMIELT